MNDAILAVRNKYNDPYIIIGGDFNRRSASEATRDYPDIRPVTTSQTRGDSTLDIVLTNFNDELMDAYTVDPIFNTEGTESDHRPILTKHRMPKVPAYQIQEYSYHHLSTEGDLKFKGWLMQQTWSDVYRAQTPSDKVVSLHKLFKEGMNHSYEWKTRRNKPQSQSG